MTITTTTEDVIKAAASIARDAAEGRLAPTALEAQAVTECRELFGTVVGEGDPLWDLHRDIARQVLAAGGVPTDELSEWLAVARQRTGEPLSPPDPDKVEPEPISLPSAALSPEDVGAEAIAAAVETEPVAEPWPEPEAAAPVTPPRQADEYDPLRGWGAARQGFVG